MTRGCARLFTDETPEEKRVRINNMITNIIVLAHDPSVRPEDADKLRLAASVLEEVRL